MLRIGKCRQCSFGLYQLTGSGVTSPGCVVATRRFFQTSSLIHVEWLVGGVSIPGPQQKECLVPPVRGQRTFLRSSASWSCSWTCGNSTDTGGTSRFSLLLLCRWACSRSTPRSPSPCPWRPKPSSCAASSPIRTGAPPLWTCSPTSS